MSCLRYKHPLRVINASVKAATDRYLSENTTDKLQKPRTHLTAAADGVRKIEISLTASISRR